MMQAEVAWIENTLLTMKAGAVATYDIKKDRKDLYAPPSEAFQLVEVPPMHFVMVDGHGDPNTVPAYRDAVEALYAASYAVRAVAKSQLKKVHTVSPLEGLWSAKDLDVFQNRDKAAWDWTMMIAQPEWITDGLVAEALAVAAIKRPSVLDLIRFERYTEGRSVQILHRGPYDDEAPTLQRLHREYLPQHGLTPTGRHHEIYLSDPRKTEPARLKTILRQPVSG